MRTPGGFAASVASFGITVAGAADGLDLSSPHLPAGMQRSAPVEAISAPRVILPSLGHEVPVGNAPRIERSDALARSPCHVQAVCYEAAEGRLVYRGARRYMPSWNGVEAEGISLKRDRLILRYSFK